MQKPDTLVLFAQDSIRNSILTGTCKAGEKLSPKEISEKLGVSAMPVKEALNRLVTEGLVTYVSRSGFRVKECTEQSLMEIIALRLMVEEYSMRFFLSHYNQLIDKLDKLDAIADEFYSWSGCADDAVIYDIDRRFHSYFVSLTGNKELDTLQNLIWNEFILYRRTCFPDRNFYVPTYTATMVNVHRTIAQQLRSKDEAGIIESMNSHFMYRLDSDPVL